MSLLSALHAREQTEICFPLAQCSFFTFRAMQQRLSLESNLLHRPAVCLRTAREFLWQVATVWKEFDNFQTKCWDYQLTIVELGQRFRQIVTDQILLWPCANSDGPESFA